VHKKHLESFISMTPEELSPAQLERLRRQTARLEQRFKKDRLKSRERHRRAWEQLRFTILD